MELRLFGFVTCTSQSVDFFRVNEEIVNKFLVEKKITRKNFEP